LPGNFCDAGCEATEKEKVDTHNCPKTTASSTRDKKASI